MRFDIGNGLVDIIVAHAGNETYLKAVVFQKDFFRLVGVVGIGRDDDRAGNAECLKGFKHRCGSGKTGIARDRFRSCDKLTVEAGAADQTA